MPDTPLSSAATGSHLGNRNVDEGAEWKWWDNVVPEIGKAWTTFVGPPAAAPAVEEYVPTTDVPQTPAPAPAPSYPTGAPSTSPRWTPVGASLEHLVVATAEPSRMSPQHVDVIATPMKQPPPPPPRPAGTPAKVGTPAKAKAVKADNLGSQFRSKRIGNDPPEPTGYNAMGLTDWKEGDALGGVHRDAALLGYSAEDYLHSRDQLVSLIERGLKPPPSLFTQLEACCHKMSPDDLREEYKWFVSTYLSEDSSIQLKGACEMLVIRVGEIVSMPRAARLAKKTSDKRLSDAGVTPRQEEVRDLAPGAGSGGKDYKDYVALRTKAMEDRKRGNKVQPGDYAEIDLRMYTLPGADMITEYKFLAELYLKYEFSETPADLYVRGFCELRLMRLGELLFMPLPVRIAAAKADVVLSKADAKMPNIVSGSLVRTGGEEYVPPAWDAQLEAVPDAAAAAALAAEIAAKPPSASGATSDTFLTPARPDPTKAAKAQSILDQAAKFAVTPAAQAAALAPPKIVAPPPPPSAAGKGKKSTPLPTPKGFGPVTPSSTKMPASQPYIHGHMPSVNMDMLKDIAILGGTPIQDPIPDKNRPMPIKADWAGNANAASAMAASENTTRSSVPNWLKKLRTRENLGGRRRDADQMRLLDLAAEAASQAAFHGAASAAVGALDHGAVIETEGTDASPQRVKYEEPSHFVAKDQLIGELRNFLTDTGGANVRAKLKKVSEDDQKGWFLREADRLRLNQISKHENRIGAIEKLEKERGFASSYSTASNAAAAKGKLAPPAKPPVFADTGLSA